MYSKVNVHHWKKKILQSIEMVTLVFEGYMRYLLVPIIVVHNKSCVYMNHIMVVHNRSCVYMNHITVVHNISCVYMNHRVGVVLKYVLEASDDGLYEMR